MPFRVRLDAVLGGFFTVWGHALRVAVARAGISVPHSIAFFAIEAGRSCWQKAKRYFG
ncbi:MAG TPA: hypothetical protein VEU08_15650 [Vicinamibacterales bacterium]|nr:hypothetical protein [Vicinamibacterales bacterium]